VLAVPAGSRLCIEELSKELDGETKWDQMGPRWRPYSLPAGKEKLTIVPICVRALRYNTFICSFKSIWSLLREDEALFICSLTSWLNIVRQKTEALKLQD